MKAYDSVPQPKFQFGAVLEQADAPGSPFEVWVIERIWENEPRPEYYYGQERDYLIAEIAESKLKRHTPK